MSDAFVRVAKRSRIGLVLGPGVMVVAIVAARVAGMAGWLPEETVPGVAYAFVGFAFVALLHVFSFAEFIATVRFVRMPGAPRSVVLLASYWVLVALVVIVTAIWRSIA